MRIVGWIQRLLLIVGLLFIGIYVGARIHRAIMSRTELRRFEDLTAKTSVGGSENVLSASGLKVDFNLWSEKRIEAYERSLAEHFDPPLALLRISKLHLEVPVLEGTDDLTLNRGVGHIAGTVVQETRETSGLLGTEMGFSGC